SGATSKVVIRSESNAVTFFGRPASIGIDQTFPTPFSFRTHSTAFPSGDQAQAPFSRMVKGIFSLCATPPATGMVSAHSYGSLWFTGICIKTFVPSGEIKELGSSLTPPAISARTADSPDSRDFRISSHRSPGQLSKINVDPSAVQCGLY